MAPKKGGGGGGQKKKKAVVSNRGFATVSVPSKKEVVEEVVGEVVREEVEEVGVEEVRREVVEEWDPEAAEREELQAVAERVRPGSDKEVARMVKVGFSLSFWRREGRW